MRLRSFVAILTLATGAACIAARPYPTPSATRLYTTDAQRAIVYGEAFRLIRLSDGSDLLLHDTRSPNEPRSVDGFLASAGGPAHDRPLRTSILLPRGVVAEGTSGHIYSASMSDDHQHLALVVGWLGASDNRGHNGVVVLKKTDRGGVWLWDRVSWFDVKGMTIGEIAFGPGDLLIVTSRNEAEPRAAVTLFSRDGTKLATFAGDGAPAKRTWSPHYMRLARISADSYALYDPESSVVRVLTIGSNAPSASATLWPSPSRRAATSSTFNPTVARGSSSCACRPSPAAAWSSPTSMRAAAATAARRGPGRSATSRRARFTEFSARARRGSPSRPLPCPAADYSLSVRIVLAMVASCMLLVPS